MGLMPDILEFLATLLLESMPRSHAPALLFTTYTPRSLAKFSGNFGGRILLAISGTVFDVTAGRGFYGPGEYTLPLFPWEKA